MVRYLGQLALTVASAAMIILIWSATSYRGAANLLLILIPPIVIGWAANQSRDRRIFMTLALAIIHYVAVSILGVLVIGY